MVVDVYDKTCFGRLWKNEEERNTTRIRGIVYSCILGFFTFFQLISIFRAAFTPPGCIPPDWDMNEKRERQKDENKQQEEKKEVIESGKRERQIMLVNRDFAKTRELGMVSVDEG